MGRCVGGVWCCELCGCVNGPSPVGCVLSLFYLYAFQMNPVCGVCVVGSGFDSRSPAFVWSFHKNRIWPSYQEGMDEIDTICADVCSSPTSCKLCPFGPFLNAQTSYRSYMYDYNELKETLSLDILCA